MKIVDGKKYLTAKEASKKLGIKMGTFWVYSYRGIFEVTIINKKKLFEETKLKEVKKNTKTITTNRWR